MVDPLPHQGVLRVVPPAQLEAAIQADDRARVEAEQEATREPELVGLAGYIRAQFEEMRNHRNDTSSGWSQRLLSAMRSYRGQYDPTKLAEIRKFGGSEVYARLIASKCRGANALLRDVYLTPDRPWGLKPPADPDVPENIILSIRQLVETEVSTLMEAGEAPDVDMIRDRVSQLASAAREAEKKKAAKRARLAEDRVEEVLKEGNFYKALSEFLVDLPLFPFACLKGPVVRMVPSVSWEGGAVRASSVPKMFWQRVSPFDLWWSPGASDIEDASVIERVKFSRADLNDLLDLPNYNHEAIREILDEHGRGGLVDFIDSTDSENADQTNKENPQMNRSGLITGLEFHGNVQGRMLLEYGMGEDQIPDPLRDYMVQAWLVGRHIIKVQLSPSPRKRHPYFITSFETVPGSPVGNALPDILSDVEEVSNATLRALVNNLAISSGPQVVVNDDRLADDEDGEDLYPWKRWHVTSDPMGNNAQVPISFFMPDSNAQNLLAVYGKFNDIADELSAIPKYMSGQAPGGGGAGRTAAGLAMLMGNSSKILQTVASNIDRDVMQPLLENLHDHIMLTDTTGMLQGNESLVVMGVDVAVQRETQRSRQIEFLTATANPIDTQIIGPKGRGAVLRSVARDIGLDGEKVVPTEDELEARQHENLAAAGAAAQGSQTGEIATRDMGPRVRVNGGAG